MKNLETSQLLSILQQSASAAYHNETMQELIQSLNLPSMLQSWLANKGALGRSILAAIGLIGSLIDLWCIASSFFSPNLIFSLIFAGFALLAGILFAGYIYSTRKKAFNNFSHSYKVASLKLDACKELKQRHALPFELAADDGPKPRVYICSELKLLVICLLSASLIFISYFYGLVFILKTLGFSAAATAMLGPVGISIAVFLAAAFGIYTSYKYHRDKKSVFLIKAQQKKIDEKIHLELQSYFLIKQNKGNEPLEEPKPRSYQPQFFVSESTQVDPIQFFSQGTSTNDKTTYSQGISTEKVQTYSQGTESDRIQVQSQGTDSDYLHDNKAMGGKPSNGLPKAATADRPTSNLLVRMPYPGPQFPIPF